MYARINARVDEMMEAGLVNEVKALLTQGVKPNCEGGAMQAIGYKEIVSALQGDISMERAVELIKQNSRRYAKRQWTWFRHDAQTKWFDYTDFSTRESLEAYAVAMHPSGLRRLCTAGMKKGRPGTRRPRSISLDEANMRIEVRHRRDIDSNKTRGGCHGQKLL